MFFAIGFETTSPTIAVALLQSKTQNIRNLYFLNSQKRIPSTIRTLLESEKIRIDGFILPGHVSAIIGSEPYHFISNEFNLPAVITGFEPVDILQGVWMLIRQIEEKRARVEIQYKRAVPEKGNPVAISKIDEAFEKDGAFWRGLGWIPDSGYAFKEALIDRDARNLEAEVEPSKEHPGCLCGEVLQGVKIPLDCNLFRRLAVLKTPSAHAWSLWKEPAPLIISIFRIFYV